MKALLSRSLSNKAKDATNSNLTIGGSHFIAVIHDYCTFNADNEFLCERVPNTDPKWNADIFTKPKTFSFTDNSNGTYSSIVNVISKGYVQMNIFLMRSA